MKFKRFSIQNESEKTQPIENKKAEDSKPELLPVVKKTEFDAYVAWKSLPSILRFPPKDKKTGEALTPTEFAMQLGIDSDEALALIEIRNQNEFCERYKVNKDTLTIWNKLIEERDLLGDLRAWAKPLTKNVALSLYNQALRGGLPDHYALWFKVVAEWNEKVNLDVRKRIIKTVKIEVIKHAN